MPKVSKKNKWRLIEVNYYNENEHPKRSGWATLYVVSGFISSIIATFFLTQVVTEAFLERTEAGYMAIVFFGVAMNMFFVAFILNVATDSRQYLIDTVNYQQLQLDAQQEQLQLLQDLKEDSKADKD